MAQTKNVKNLSGNFEADKMWFVQIQKERNGLLNWHYKNDCLVEEYKKYYEELENLRKANAAEVDTRKKGKPNTRVVGPLPDTTGHVPGWLATRKEFKLEIYGPDIPQMLPFMSLYEI